MPEQPQRDWSLLRSPCPICGGKEFTWGRVAGGSFLRFFADDEGWLKANIGKAMGARECKRCGNIQVFTK